MKSDVRPRRIAGVFYCINMSKKREGFNFYRSYYDVYMELSDKDRVLFMDALLNKQFTGVEPNDLKGLAKFAYLSQKHSIDKQIKGWEDKTKEKLHPYTPPLPRVVDNPTEPPCQQVQEEVQGKEEYTIPTSNKSGMDFDFDRFLIFFNQTLGKKHKLINDSVRSKIKARLKEGYTKHDFQSAIVNIAKEKHHIETGFKHVTPEFISRPDKLEMYISRSEVDHSKVYVEPKHCDY